MKQNQKAKGTATSRSVVIATLALLLLGKGSEENRTEAAVSLPGKRMGESANFNIGMLFPLLIGFLLLSALVTEVTYNAQQAQANESVTGATSALVGILGLLFIAIPILLIFRSKKMGG